MKNIFLIFFLFINISYAKQEFKVFGATPLISYLIYSIDSNLISGLNYEFRKDELQYLHKNMKKLPILGGLLGQGKSINLETLLKNNPSLILTDKTIDSYQKVYNRLETLGFKTYSLNIDSLDDYVRVYEELAVVLHKEERSKSLCLYTKKVLEDIKNLKKKIENNKKTVIYYAQGLDGLQTECQNSSHARLIEYIGAKNPHRCLNSTTYGRDRITLEKLIQYDPEIIIAQEKEFYNKIYKDSKFSQIKAVKNKKVYLIPKLPFNWFDRPTSFMQILGVQWLANLVYEQYNIDINKKSQEFYRLFLNKELSKEEIDKILKG